MHIDQDALQSSLRRLREAAFDADVVAVLDRAVGAVHRVFGCSGAGVMFVTEAGALTAAGQGLAAICQTASGPWSASR